MNDTVRAPDGGEIVGSRPIRSHPPLLVALAALLFLEALVVAGAAVWLVIEMFTAEPASFASAVALVVLVAVAAVWVTSTAVAALLARSWARASAVTIQVLQIAVAVGSFQGLYARPDLAWALLVPALIGIGLALSPQVVRATSRNTSQHE